MATPPPDLQFSFTQVGIKWKQAIEDDASKLTTLKGTFESNGKTYEVSVTYNKGTLAGKIPDEQLGGINDKIKNSLDSIDSQMLAKLSGHTIRTNYDELQTKKIHVLSGDKEIDEWQKSNVADAVTKIENVFQSVFGLTPTPPVKKKDDEEEEDDEEEVSAKAADDVKIEFSEAKPEDKTLKGVLPEKEYQAIQPRLKKIEALIDEQGVAAERKQEFLQLLADSITEDAGKKYVVSSMNDTVELDDFLKDVEEGLLTKGSIILDDFIDHYLFNLVNAPQNTNTAFIASSIFRIGEDKNETSLDDLEYIYGENVEEVKKVIIPVNIADTHSIVYCFDCTDPKKPVLHRCDSLPQIIQNHHKESIKNLEEQLLVVLSDEFKIPKESIEVKIEKVTEQENNNGGAHVCKIAEWFMTVGKFNVEGIKPHEFTPVRTDMLFAFLGA